MSAKRDTPGSRSLTRLYTLKACEENSPQPFRLRRMTRTNQGLRSFHSLTPTTFRAPLRGADSLLNGADCRFSAEFLEIVKLDLIAGLCAVSRDKAHFGVKGHKKRVTSDCDEVVIEVGG